jgi:hypothetical protein
MKESTEFEMSHSKNLGTASQVSRPPISHRRHVVTAVKIQWRAFVLALDALVAFLFYWVRGKKSLRCFQSIFISKLVTISTDLLSYTISKTVGTA